MNITGIENSINTNTSKFMKLEETGGKNFQNMFTNAFDSINNEQKVSEFNMEQIATGKTENLQKSILQIDQASLSLSLALEIQNKLLSGFKEVISTQV